MIIGNVKFEKTEDHAYHFFNPRYFALLRYILYLGGMMLLNSNVWSKRSCLTRNIDLFNLFCAGGDSGWAAFPEPGGESTSETAVSRGADTWGSLSAATVTAVPDDIDEDEFGDFEDVPSISVSVPKVSEKFPAQCFKG